MRKEHVKTDCVVLRIVWRHEYPVRLKQSLCVRTGGVYSEGKKVEVLSISSSAGIEGG
jgi:hypothetical protein